MKNLRNINEMSDTTDLEVYTANHKIDTEAIKAELKPWTNQVTGVERFYIAKNFAECSDRDFSIANIFFSEKKENAKYIIEFLNGYLHAKAWRCGLIMKVARMMVERFEAVKDEAKVKETKIKESLSLKTIKSLISRPGIYNFCKKITVSVNVINGVAIYSAAYTTTKTKKIVTRQIKSISAILSLAYRQGVVKIVKKAKGNKTVERKVEAAEQKAVTSYEKRKNESETQAIERIKKEISEIKDSGRIMTSRQSLFVEICSDGIYVEASPSDWCLYDSILRAAKSIYYFERYL